MPKKKTIHKKVAEYPFIIDNITFSQEGNCCTGGEERERLTIEFHNGGGGYFYIFKTDMFAFDCESDEHKKIIEKSEGICKSNDIHDEKEYREYCIREDIREGVNATEEVKASKPKENNVTCISLNT